MKMKYGFPALIACALAACAGSERQPHELMKITAPAAHDTFDNPRLNPNAPALALRDGINDPTLTRLINATLRNNRDLQTARANLAQARATAKEATGDQYPEIFAGAGAARQRLSEEFSAAKREFSSFDAGFDSLWELDLFGKKSALVKAARADMQATEAISRGLAVSVAAETARNYIELRGEQRRLRVLKRNAANQKQALDLTNTLTEFGDGNILDSERARASYEVTLAAIPESEARIRAFMNRLAVLSGQAPASVRGSLEKYAPLPSVPPMIGIGAPAELLRRRPDIQTAEYELKAALARYDFQNADLYPSISLQGSVGFLATGLSDFISSGASRFLFGPNLRYNLFDFGQARARVDASDAAAQAKLAAFEQTILTALEETDSALIAFSKAEQTRLHLLQAASAADKASASARDRFDAGADSFLSVLDADRTLLATEEQLTRSETDLLLKLIAVYKALGV